MAKIARSLNRILERLGGTPKGNDQVTDVLDEIGDYLLENPIDGGGGSSDGGSSDSEVKVIRISTTSDATGYECNYTGSEITAMLNDPTLKVVGEFHDGEGYFPVSFGTVSRGLITAFVFNFGRGPNLPDELTIYRYTIAPNSKTARAGGSLDVNLSDEDDDDPISSIIIDMTLSRNDEGEIIGTLGTGMNMAALYQLFENDVMMTLRVLPMSGTWVYMDLALVAGGIMGNQYYFTFCNNDIENDYQIKRVIISGRSDRTDPSDMTISLEFPEAGGGDTQTGYHLLKFDYDSDDASYTLVNPLSEVSKFADDFSDGSAVTYLYTELRDGNGILYAPVRMTRGESRILVSFDYSHCRPNNTVVISSGTFYIDNETGAINPEIYFADK